jgi:transcriptional regulator with PAS, ATPase and Fis domain
MLIRLVLAIKNRKLQTYLEKNFHQFDDIQVESCSDDKSPWQSVIRSCGDIIVVSESFIPPQIESSIAMLNELPETPTTVVLHNSDSSEEHAQLVGAGADVVLYAGISRKSLVEAIESTLESRRQFIQKNRLHAKGQSSPRLNDFISQSRNMQVLMEEIWKVIPSNAPLLVLGETGVGKEHLARAIHAESPRSAGPFVAVNAAALQEQLLESELFGHEEGAFTGAIRSRRGAFEMAHGGTIFLDEIGEMPLHLQAKLLRVLQDYEVRPLGSERSTWVDIRVIAATNQNLEHSVEKGTFRKDLYYRLSVIMLTIPPLVQRAEDIPGMVHRFIEYYQMKIGKDIKGVTEAAMQALCQYGWPGNVRELMNVIERAILLCQTEIISVTDLPYIFHEPAAFSSQMVMPGALISESWKGKTLPEVREQILDQVDREYLTMVLRQTKGRIGEAAGIAGIHSRALYNKMKRLGLSKKTFKGRRKEGEGLL